MPPEFGLGPREKVKEEPRRYMFTERLDRSALHWVREVFEKIQLCKLWEKKGFKILSFHVSAPFRFCFEVFCTKDQNSKTKRNDETTPPAATSDPEETTAPNINSYGPEGSTPPAASSDPGLVDFNFFENEISNNKADTVGIFNFGNNKTGGSSDSKIRRFNFEGNKILKNNAKNVLGFSDFGNEY